MPSTKLSPDQVPDGWDAVASAYDERIMPTLRRFGLDAVRLADLQTGEQVLDVACGSGAVALAAADQGAHVTAIDFAPAMVARLRERAEQLGATVRAEVMDGQALTLPDRSFDAVLSNMGLIFFPRPDQGLGEMHRVLRPGGRVVVTTWQGLPHNGVLELFGGALERAFPDLAPPPPPAWLGLADPETLLGALETAGFQDVRVTATTHAFESDSPEDCWQSMTTTNPVVPALLGQVGADGHERLRAAVLEALRQRGGDGPVRLENTANVAVAMR